jgi:hypothetical protein
VASAEPALQLGCVWRPKNASLFCLGFDANANNKSDVTGVTRDHRDAAKTVELECFSSQESDLKKIVTTKDAKSDRKNRPSDDYLDDDDASQTSQATQLWSHLQFIKVSGCPIHQVAVNDVKNDAKNDVKNDVKNVRHFPRPILRGVDTKSDDLFSDFLQPSLGGQVSTSFNVLFFVADTPNN